MSGPTPAQWNKILLILLVLFSCGLIYLLSPILLPFFIAFLLAYVTDPLVNRLTRYHIPRTGAVIIVFLTLFVTITILVILLIPIIQKQIITLIELTPSTLDWVQEKISYLMSILEIEKPSQINAFNHVQPENLIRAGGGVKWLLQTTLYSGKVVILDIISIILTLVVTFYLLRDWHSLLRKTSELIPRKIEPGVAKFARECDSVLSQFLRGQLLVMLFVAVFYSIALTILGIKIGVLIGLVIGLLSIVPYLGVIMGILIASVAAFFQFGTVLSLLWVLFIFLVGHSIENFYLTPKLVGERIGLHPVAVIFAILAGGELFGFLGVLLALPFAAVLMVLLRNIRKQYHRSHIYTS